ADRRQRLAAKAERHDARKIVASELGSGVALDGEGEIVGGAGPARPRAGGATERERSAGASPPPSSATRISPSPLPATATSMRREPASIAFSISSLTTLAGRSTTSPAAMRLTRSGGSCLTGIRGLCLFAGEIPTGQDFTRFYCRLVEWVDAKEVRRKDRLEHEMHHQRANRPLVQHRAVYCA